MKNIKKGEGEGEIKRKRGRPKKEWFNFIYIYYIIIYERIENLINCFNINRIN